MRLIDRLGLCFVNSVSLCEHGLRFWVCCVMMHSFCFCDVGYSCLICVDKRFWA
nr:MAG TPA: hypothetical protein [Caudoviricetes sp.]